MIHIRPSGLLFVIEYRLWPIFPLISDAFALNDFTLTSDRLNSRISPAATLRIVFSRKPFLYCFLRFFIFFFRFVGEKGVEPLLREPKPLVQPIHHSPVTNYCVKNGQVFETFIFVFPFSFKMHPARIDRVRIAARHLSDGILRA